MTEYKVSQKVLVSRPSLIGLFPANVLEIEDGSYYIHYKGWNSKYDEWVEEEDLRPINEETMKEFHELEDKIKEIRRKEKEATVTHKQTSKGNKRKVPDKRTIKKKCEKRKKRDGLECDIPMSVVSPKDIQQRVDSSIVLPLQFQVKLKENWEEMHVNKRILTVPKQYTVQKMLTEYVKNSPNKQQQTLEKVRKTLVNGIIKSFNFVFDKILLYEFEHPQYEQITGKPSDVFGIEHLARFFVKLPFITSRANMSESEAENLHAKVGELMEYLAQTDAYWYSSFKTVDKEYLSAVSEFAENAQIDSDDSGDDSGDDDDEEEDDEDDDDN